MPNLSPLMHKILELVYGEHTDSEIAKELGLKRKTVSNYLSELIYPGHWFRLIPNVWDGEGFCQG
jgi:DNA-binding transcriptional regulator LsrR (DeoR family)